MEKQFVKTKVIEIYADGACLNNPGVGGWAFVYADHSKEKSGAVENTTNNQMELMAIGKAIASTPENSVVKIFSDSQYAINVITGKFQRNKNIELLAKIDSVIAKRNVTFEWVKSHSGNVLNEYCDKLACSAAKKLAKRRW